MSVEVIVVNEQFGQIQQQLLTAVQNGNVEQVKLLVDANPELATTPFPEKPHEKSYSRSFSVSNNKPLIVAIHHIKGNDLSIIEYLLSKGATFDTTDPDGRNSLMTFVRQSTTENLNKFVTLIPSSILEKLLLQRDDKGNNLLFHAKINYRDRQMPLAVLKLYPPILLARELCWVNSDCFPGFYALGPTLGNREVFAVNSVAYRTWAASLEPKQVSDRHDMIHFHQLLHAYSMELLKAKLSLNHLPKNERGTSISIDEWKTSQHNIRQLFDVTSRTIVKFDLEEKIGPKLTQFKKLIEEYENSLLKLQSDHYGEAFNNDTLNATTQITQRILVQLNELEVEIIEGLKSFDDGMAYLFSQETPLIQSAAAKNNVKVLDCLLQTARQGSIPIDNNLLTRAFWEEAAKKGGSDVMQYFMQNPFLKQTVFVEETSEYFNAMLMDKNADVTVVDQILRAPEANPLLLKVTTKQIKALINNGRLNIVNHLFSFDEVGISYDDWAHDYYNFYYYSCGSFLTDLKILEGKRSKIINTKPSLVVMIAAVFGETAILKRALKECHVANNILELQHALFTALSRGHLTAVKCLLDVPEVMAALKNEPVKALYCAVESNNVELVAHMLSIHDIKLHAGGQLPDQNPAEPNIALKKSIDLGNVQIFNLLMNQPEVIANIHQMNFGFLGFIRTMPILTRLLDLEVVRSNVNLVMEKALLPFATHGQREQLEAVLQLPTVRNNTDHVAYVKAIAEAGSRGHVEIANLLISLMKRPEFRPLMLIPHSIAARHIQDFCQHLRTYAALTCTKGDQPLARLQQLPGDIKRLIFSKMGITVPARLDNAIKAINLKPKAADVEMSEASGKRSRSPEKSPEKRKRITERKST